MEKKLARPQEGRMFSGVCAGIADFFGLDVTMVRVAYVLLACLAGGGIIAYIIMTIIIPKKN